MSVTGVRCRCGRWLIVNTDAPELASGEPLRCQQCEDAMPHPLCEISCSVEERCERLLDYLETYIAAHHFPPSRREMAEYLHCSTSTIQRALEFLQADAMITMVPGVARSVQLQPLDGVGFSLTPLGRRALARERLYV